MPRPDPASLGDTPAPTPKSEHRQVTVLIADLVGYTPFVERAGGEAAYTLMSHLSGLMTASVHHHRGSVMSYTGDGIIALFGAPVALEDGPLRACRAALDIQQRLIDARSKIEAEVGLRPELRIGLTTGPAVLGAVDSGESTSVTAFGDIVNLAARLQTEAPPGAVVMSEALFRQVEGIVESELAGTFRFKGKTEPQAVYRLLAIRERATRFDAAVARGLTSYVGRNRELAILEEQLKSLNAVRVVDVVGDPGIGKSRLLYEFALLHSADKVVLIRGNCTTDGEETPFLPFIEVVRASFSVTSGEPRGAIIRKLDEGLKRLGYASQLNLGLLLNLLGLESPQGALSGLDGTLVGTRTRDLLLQLVEAQCLLSPVVLLLEDLHWIDSASEELLHRIVASEKKLPLMILHTRRPEYRPPWLNSRCVIALPIFPLASAETTRIAEDRLSVEKIPAVLAQLIVEKAEGNPLFVEEFARFLIERGAVYRTVSGLAFDSNLVSTALPASIQLLLTARVDRLSVEDRALLQVAAVIGRRFDYQLAAEVIDIRGSIEDRLASIATLCLVQRDASTQNYEFKHVLIRDALYNSLGKLHRAELHRKVANAIELRATSRFSEVAETLAYHFSCSDQYAKAFQYLSLSGQKCLDIYSLEEAEHNFRKALEFLDLAPNCADDQAMATVMANLLQVLYLRGDLLSLRDAAERYIPRLQAFGDTPQLVFGLYFHCMLLEHFCEFRLAEGKAHLALDIAQRVGDVRAQAYALSALFFCSTVLGRYSLDVAERKGAAMLDICEQADDRYILNWAYWSIAWDYVCRGLTKKAHMWAVRLMDAGERRRDDRAVGMAHWTLAWIDIQDLRFSDAMLNAERSLKAAATPFDRTAGTIVRATGLLLEGRLHEGLAQLLALKRWATDNGWLYSASGIDFAAGPALAAIGRVGEGIRMLEAGIVACDASGSRALASWNRLALAELYLHILSTEQSPSLKFILANLIAILKARIVGRRRAQILLSEASENEQFHENSTTRCRITIDLAKLALLNNKPSLARQHLLEAHIAATAHESPLLSEIDGMLKSLSRLQS